MEQLWHSSNLPFNRQARGSENRTGVSFFFPPFFSRKEEVWIQIFCISFCLAIQREWEEGRKCRQKKKKKITREETNSTHTHKHTCTNTLRGEKKKKTRDIINIWMPYANGRERADVVAFNWPICELHPNLSVCFLGPLCTVSTGFLVPHNIWAANVAILAVFKHKGRETRGDSKQWHENGFLGLGFVCRKIVVSLCFVLFFWIMSLSRPPWRTNYKK